MKTFNDLYKHITSGANIHRSFSDEPVTYSVNYRLGRHLNSLIQPGMKTLETGIGVSTILFAMKRTNHICVAPCQKEVNRFIDHCYRLGIATDTIRFIVKGSEKALPYIEVKDRLDLILIDGGHGFPTPFIDWYYTNEKLKEGGHLIVDDAQMWTGHILSGVLNNDPHWKLEKHYFYKAYIYKKVLDCDVILDWYHQNYVRKMQKSPFSRTFYKYQISLLIEDGSVIYDRVRCSLQGWKWHLNLPNWPGLASMYYWQVHNAIRKVIIDYIIKPTFYFVRNNTKLAMQFSLYGVRDVFYRLRRGYFAVVKGIWKLNVPNWPGLSRMYFWKTWNGFKRGSWLLWDAYRKRIFYPLKKKYYVPVKVAAVRDFVYLRNWIVKQIKTSTKKSIQFVWRLNIPNWPGLVRMYFWKAIPQSVRRKALKKRFRQLVGRNS